MSMDLYFFTLINGFAGKRAWLDYSAIFFAKYFEYFLLFSFIILVWLNLYDRGKLTALKALISVVVSRFVFTEIIRFIWFRPRPFVAESFVPLINQNPAEASFPSGHASFYFALSTIIYFYNKKAGTLFFIASFLVAISRVYVGVHWPSDILAGVILGILTAWAVNKIFNRYIYEKCKGYF